MVVTNMLHCLQSDPSTLHGAHSEKVGRHRSRLKQIADSLSDTRSQAKYYRSLAQQQRAYFLQRERVAVQGGSKLLARHPTGEIFLVPLPAAIGDDTPKHVWDVGTAIANPYVCDSWPFEPNVLARRCFQEAPMSPFSEETPEDLEDLEEERESLRYPFRSGMQLPPASDDDDDDDAYPTGTARGM